MYNPPHFKESRSEELERIIYEHPLGTLVYLAPDGLDAAHLPFIYKKEAGEKGTLKCSFAGSPGNSCRPSIPRFST